MSFLYRIRQEIGKPVEAGRIEAMRIGGEIQQETGQSPLFNYPGWEGS